MPRTFIVKEDTDLDTLGRTMLDARVRKDLAEAALAQLKERNPHVDPAALAAGTVLIVPETPGLKPSAGEAVFKTHQDNLKALVGKALEGATERSRAGRETRAAERAEIAKTMKSAAFRKAATGSEAPVEQFKQAPQLLADQEKADAEAGARLKAMSEAATAAFAQLDKLVR